MKRRKAVIMIASLLLVSSLLLLIFTNLNQNKHASVNTQPIMKPQEDIAAAKELKQMKASKEAAAETENPPSEAVAKDEEPLVTESENAKLATITQEIKDKVRVALEGAFNLFQQDLKIVSIGDSLTQGVGDETESGGYVGILNHTFEDKDLNINIENYGKRGNRTDQLLKRLDQEEIADSIEKADVVLITIGANDIMKVFKNNFTNLTMEPFEKERPQYTERLRSIFNTVNELNPDTQIYLIGFYNPFDRYFSDIKELDTIMTTWNETGKAVTEEYENVHYIPVADLFSNSQVELLADDYFHPNTSGYKLIAQRVLDSLEEIPVDTEVAQGNPD